jgi:NADH-quinone oxidoreductase subunit C
MSDDSNNAADGNTADSGAEAEAEEPQPVHPVIEALEGAFSGRFEHEGDDALGTPIVRLGQDALVEVSTWLLDDESTRFDLLSSVTAIDWTEREPRFDVVYHLYSLPRRHRLSIKVGCDAESGVPTVVQIWPAADWLERETFDLYGIIFRDHPDLRRVFLPEEWEGHPLRKDYPLEGPNLELLTRQQAAFRGGRFDRIRGEYEMNDQEREMAGPGIVGALWTPKPPEPEGEGAEPDGEESS